MNRSALCLTVALFIGLDAAAEPLTLTAADGVEVYGEYWPSKDAPAPIVVAFHQAGSNHAEYAPLAARLNEAGYGVVAIDQRSGGPAFGGGNRTVAKLGRSTGFEEALPDLEAALAWSRDKAAGAPVLVWGSSYSAALVFELAAAHPRDVQGVLAFSPGEYLKDPKAVRRAARMVRVPVFIDQAVDGEEVRRSRAILEAVATPDRTQFVPTRGGVHGSSTLRADRNARGADENWTAVFAFLAKFGSSR